MSITTYAELQTAVARWLKRDDLTAYIPDYIQFGENRLRYGDKGQFPTSPLRLRDYQGYSDGTSTGRSFPFIDPTFNTQVFIETISLSVTYGGSTYPLRYLPPQQFVEYDNDSGAPAYYTIKQGQFSIGPGPDVAYTHNYYYAPSSLSTTDNTNTLLTQYPDLYLFAACIEGALDIMSDSMAQRFASRLQGRLNTLNGLVNSNYAGGSLGITIGR